MFRLVSDTEEGRFVGDLLVKFFEKNKFGYILEAERSIISDLDDKRTHDFKHRGLRNFVREVGRIIKNYNGNVAINATGGYKAQIAFAVAIGQALNVPVYYRFERFPTIIELPPLPITLSPDVFRRFEGLFVFVESFGEVDKKTFKKIARVEWSGSPSELKVFLEDVDGKIMTTPMGEIYLYSVWDLSYDDLKKYKFLALEKSPSEKFRDSSKEHCGKKLQNRVFKPLIDDICSLELVDEVILSGCGTKFTGNRMSAKVIPDKDPYVKVEVSSNEGNITLKVFSKSKYEKILEALKEKIMDVMERRL